MAAVRLGGSATRERLVIFARTDLIEVYNLTGRAWLAGYEFAIHLAVPLADDRYLYDLELPRGGDRFWIQVSGSFRRCACLVSGEVGFSTRYEVEVIQDYDGEPLRLKARLAESNAEEVAFARIAYQAYRSAGPFAALRLIEESTTGGNPVWRASSLAAVAILLTTMPSAQGRSISQYILPSQALLSDPTRGLGLLLQERDPAFAGVRPPDNIVVYPFLVALARGLPVAAAVLGYAWQQAADLLEFVGSLT